jgi:hypothetical protein
LAVSAVLAANSPQLSLTFAPLGSLTEGVSELGEEDPMATINLIFSSLAGVIAFLVSLVIFASSVPVALLAYLCTLLSIFCILCTLTVFRGIILSRSFETEGLNA